MILKFILPLFALSLVIAIHELGHLIIAKFFKIKVEVYSIGIGKKLLSKTFRGTEYALSIIPFGGYCKLKGGDINNASKDIDSIDTLNPFKKIAIYVAGPFFNILLTTLLLIFIYLIPIHQKIPPIIQPVLGQDLPAELSGIEKGDEILKINNIIINEYKDISKNISNNNLLLEIKRDDSIIKINVTPIVNNNNSIIGIYPFIPLNIVKPGSSGLLYKDQIISINEKAVSDILEAKSIINDLETINLSVKRGNELIDYTLAKKDFNSIDFINSYSYGLFDSIKNGITETKEMLKSIVMLLYELIKKGDIGKSISSPIRLVYEVGITVNDLYKQNSILVLITNFLSIIASISISLGFINLLPIPVLDGGQILLNVITIIKRKPLSSKFIYIYQTAGLILVLLLFSLGVSNDIFFFGDLK
ncbi:MAG: site-2 protease family protein [Spirochaetales bacterium]|nr:site-2 protease family protein [Spirochaetales bacterium]